MSVNIQQVFFVSIFIIVTSLIIHTIYTSVCLLLPIHVFMFLIESLCTRLKNSSYIFTRRGRRNLENYKVCRNLRGYLVSIETDEEWKFINHEIQKRNSWNITAWHIGLYKNYSRDWIWNNGASLNISKWRDSEPNGNDTATEISMNGGLFNGISKYGENAFICEIPGGKEKSHPCSTLYAKAFPPRAFPAKIYFNG